jgi:hypothetical protein
MKAPWGLLCPFGAFSLANDFREYAFSEIQRTKTVRNGQVFFLLSIFLLKIANQLSVLVQTFHSPLRRLVGMRVSNSNR